VSDLSIEPEPDTRTASLMSTQWNDVCMPDRPRDLNAMAAPVVNEATDENPAPRPDDGKGR
jgi:hypothetical protein